MLESPPRVITWVILSAAAAGCFEIARRQSPEDFRSLFIILAITLTVAAGMTALDWIVYKVSIQLRILFEMRAVTERVKVIEAISRLNDRQVEYMRNINPAALAIPGEPGPVLYYLRLGDGEISYDFIDQFLELSDEKYLVPVGTWAEGSKKREWAALLTNHLIMQGFAERHNGNRSAKWVDKSRALKWLGMEEG